MTTQATQGATPGSKGLKGNALGLMSSVVIGLSSTAPAYSLAASLGLVVVLAGDKSPGIMILAFIPMYLIAVAYRELNKAEPDCGTTFTWAGRAFGPWVGWLGGWGIIAADVIVMANLAQIAGSYTFTLFGAKELAESTLWSTVAGVIWILLMTYICYRGIEVSARLQYALLGIELSVLFAFAIVAFVKVYSGDAPDTATTPSLAWLWPSGMSIADLVSAVLIAVFLYWGWDTAVACNEESDDPGSTPGRAGVIATLLLVATNVLVTAAAVAFAGTGTTGIGLGNPENESDVFAAIGPAIFGDSALGQAFTILLIISVLTSSAACTQTTILPTARAALSMGVYQAIPKRFAKIHPRYLTPSVATWGMGIVSIVFYVGLTFLSSNVLADSIAAVGLLIAFYYGLTGFACVWYYRHHLRGKDLWTKGVLPGLGALLLLGAFIISAVKYLTADTETLFGSEGPGVFIIGIGSLVLGGILMVVYSRIAPAFFRGETLVPGSHDLLLTPAGSVAHVGLPDSGEEPTVIAPDLSNLPPGRKPHDPS